MTPTSARRVVRHPITVAVVTLCVLLCAAEALARFGLGGLLAPGLGADARRLEYFRAFVTRTREPGFAPHAYTGFTLNPKATGVNSMGFRDGEWRRERRPGVPRIACLGGSTTEGEQEGQKGSFPFQLGAILSERLGREVEVQNFGVSGWTSCETMVNYFVNVQDFAPDVVVLHESVNDVRPRLWPDFRSDYSHYRRPWIEPRYGALGRWLIGHSVLVAALELERQPDFGLNALVDVPLADESELARARLEPRTTEPFRRNLSSIAQHVEARGGHALLTTMPFAPQSEFYAGVLGQHVRPGIIEHNQVVRDLADDEGFALLDLAEVWRSREATLMGHFKDHVHVTKAGNRVKAELLADEIERRGWLTQSPR